MLSMKSGLKKLALAGIAAVGLAATSTAANADWYGHHYGRHWHRGGEVRFNVSFGDRYGYDYLAPYYGLPYFSHAYDNLNWADRPYVFCSPNSGDYNPYRCRAFESGHGGY